MPQNTLEGSKSALMVASRHNRRDCRLPEPVVALIAYEVQIYPAGRVLGGITASNTRPAILIARDQWVVASSILSMNFVCPPVGLRTVVGKGCRPGR